MRRGAAFLLASIGFVVPAGARTEEPGPTERQVAELVSELVSELDSEPPESEDRVRLHDRLVRAVEEALRRGRGVPGGEEDGAARRDARRAAVLGLYRLALDQQTEPEWRAEWRERLTEATAWAREEPDMFGAAAMLGYVASTAWMDATEIGRAADLLDSLLADPRLAEERLQTRLLERRASAARQLGETARALELLERARRSAPRGEPGLVPYLLAEEFHALVNLGLTDRAARVLDLQEERIARAEEEAGEEAGEEDELARAVLAVNRVRLAYARARHAKVIRETERLLGGSGVGSKLTRQRARLAFYRALSLTDRALATGEGRPAAASALEALLESGDLDDLALNRRHVLQRRAALALAEGDLEEAEEFLRRGDRDVESEDEDLTLQDVRHDSLRSQVRRQREIAAEVTTRDAPECARLLARFDTFLRAWERSPIDEAGVGFLHFPYRREVVGECLEAAEWLADDEPTAAFELLMKVQAMGTLARRHAIAAPDLETVRRRLLPEGVGLLAFVPGPFGSHLFAVDREHVEHVRLPPEAELAAAHGAMRRHLVAPPEGTDGRSDVRAFVEASSRLARRLFPPSIAARLGEWRSVYVAGIDLLGPVAVEALAVPGLGELGTARAVSRLPSVPVGVWLAARAEATAGRDAGEERGEGRRDGDEERGERTTTLFVATEWDAARWPDPERLPLTDADVELLRGGVPESRWSVRLGDEATLDGVAGAAGRDRLVIVAHGEQDPTRVRPAGLLLADGFLGADEVERRFAGGAAPALVVLAACEGDRGPLRRGDDGVQQQSGAWFSRGALSVATSDRALDYHATVRLVGRMIAEMEEGRSAAEALRRARAALKSDPRFDHPFFYANLHLVGLLGDR